MAGEGVAHTETKGWLYFPKFPAELRRRALYSLAQWVNGLPFRDIDFSSTGMPIIKIAEIKGGISDQTKRTQQTFDESVRVKSGDLLFSWSGQPETSIDAFWWRGPEGWLNQHVFRVTPASGIDPVYLFYVLRYLKPNFVEIARNKQTTGLGHVTKRDLESIEAAVPAAQEQRAIAHILGTLDDKIHQNRRMNETLEAMARAMFKSWFVDFDPVRAKASGEPPESICRRLRLTRDLLALFPDRLVDSELGEIPEGWEVGLLGDCIEILDSKRVPLSSREREVRRGQYPYHGAASVMDYVDGFLFDGVYVLAGEDGSVIASGGKPVLQYVWGKFWVNNHAHVLRARPPMSNEQLLLQLGEVNIGPFVTGAVQAKLSQSNLRRIEVVHAPDQVIAAFGSLVGPLYDMIRSLTDESRTLAVARDALLPEIFAGRVRVPLEGAS
jgi:restriction endonuclease S subunit